MDPFTLGTPGHSGIFSPHVDMLYFSFIPAFVFLSTDFIIYLPLVFWHRLSWDYCAANRTSCCVTA